MRLKAMRGELALVHWHPEEADDLAESLRKSGWIVRVGIGELREVRAKPPTAILISLRRLPSHGREVANALWFTKWGRAIPIVFFDGQADKVEATRTDFPNARFVKWAEVPAVLQQIAGNPLPQDINRRGSKQEARPGRVKAKERTDEGFITVENVNVPGYTANVNAAKYTAMRQAILVVLPRTAPGLSQTEIRRAVLPHLPEELFPAGAKAPWWAKTVQLDLEAKGIVRRDITVKPLKWYQVAPSKKKRNPGA